MPIISFLDVPCEVACCDLTNAVQNAIADLVVLEDLVIGALSGFDAGTTDGTFQLPFNALLVGAALQQQSLTISSLQQGVDAVECCLNGAVSTTPF